MCEGVHRYAAGNRHLVGKRRRPEGLQGCEAAGDLDIRGQVAELLGFGPPRVRERERSPAESVSAATASTVPAGRADSPIPNAVALSRSHFGQLEGDAVSSGSGFEPCRDRPGGMVVAAALLIEAGEGEGNVLGLLAPEPELRSFVG